MGLPAIHRRLLLVVAALLVLTLAGMVALWPHADQLPGSEADVPDLVTAEVLTVEVVADDPDPALGGSGELLVLTVELLRGDEAGAQVDLEVVPEGYPPFAVGDRVELDRVLIDGEEPAWFIVDFRRLPTLWLLLGLFVLAVVAVGRWHGLRSLLGLAISLMIIVRFVVPAILVGRSPPLVAIVGAIAIMIVTLYLAHGVNEMTTSAIIGTGAALLLTVGLAVVIVDRAKITGYASDEANLVSFAFEGLDLQGLVLAGLIIAALGVLDDVTVSQASTVFALHDTDRTLSWSALFARAMKVGRDHIASVVNTLFLAYAGASLALLVLFSTSGLPATEIVNSEVFAEELVKTVIGSLGLIAAVPFTTALAAHVAVSREPDPPVGQGAGDGRSDGPDGPGGPDGPDGLDGLDEEQRAQRSWARYLTERGQRSPDAG